MIFLKSHYKIYTESLKITQKVINFRIFERYYQMGSYRIITSSIQELAEHIRRK